MARHQSGPWQNNHRDTNQFSEAGEQAVRLIGQFVTIASDLGRTLGDGVDLNARSSGKPADSDASEVLRESGKKLREFREAAGYSIEAFAKALDRQGAEAAVAAAEAGRSAFPKPWLERAASLLSNGDPLAFYENFYRCYDSEDSVTGESDLGAERAESLAEMFHGDSQLGKLSEHQFAKLHQHMASHYASVKALLDDPAE